MKPKLFGSVSAVLAVLVTGFLVATTLAPVGATGPGGQHRELLPVIFVHGGAGSGAQFESQAQRLTSNGYPQDLIYVHEYDSSFSINTMAQVHEGLDALIAQALESSGADKVDLLGHSLGTAVSQSYLNSSPERAAKVAHYVNLDGAGGTALPGGVPTLAVWGEGNQSRNIGGGAENYYAPDQSHVQVATSKETFRELYEFFTGEEPRTIDVTPERPDRVRISGEVNYFPQNNGVEGATLKVWEINLRTGRRVGREPKATYEIGADGAWGPFRANGNKRYEFEVHRVIDGVERTHHFYAQNFFRSDHLVRLLTSDPNSAIGQMRDSGPGQISTTIVRYKEMWGDQGENNDALAVNGENVLNAVTAPRTERVNAVYIVDDNSDGVSHLDSVIADLSALPFISGIDLFVDGALPPNDTVSYDMTSRSTDGDAEEINVPNWASETHHVTVQFRDYEQDQERYGR